MHHILERLSSNGRHHDSDPKTIHSLSVSNRYSLVIFIGCLLVVLTGWMGGHELDLGWITLLGLTALYSIVHLSITGKHRLPFTILSLVLIVFGWWLVATGGSDGNGFLWIFAIPPFVLSTLGLWRGLLLMLVFFFGILAELFFINSALSIHSFPDSFILHFLLSLSLCTVFVALTESARRHSEQKLIALSHEMARCARIDPLTGLDNRRSLCEKFDYEQIRAKRNDSRLSLIMCDVDHFKTINDTFGHSCGDYILREMASLLSASVRAQDIVCRWGGEEFLLLLPDTTENGASKLAEKIRVLIEQYTFSYYGNPVPVTLSLGVHECGNEGHADYHIRMADQKLYMAKDRGRNTVVAGCIPDILVPSALIAEQEDDLA